MASSIEVAEMAKLLENSYRSVNIGLVNELKILCHKTKINIHDVISAASTKPFGFRPFKPGPGVGGHCIPIDPIFLDWFAKKNNTKTELIRLARQKNLEVTSYISNNLLKLIKSNESKKVLLLGVAYKKNVNDYRESPAIKIINILSKRKIRYDYYDPYIQSIYLKSKKKIFSLKTLSNITSYDIVVLITDHDKLPYKEILKKSKLLIDTRGYYKNTKSNKVLFL